VLRVADDEFEPARGLEHGVYGLPVHARALHRHVCDLLFTQPLDEVEELTREGRELAHRLTQPRAFAHEHAGGDLLLVHVESADPIDDDAFHDHLRGWRRSLRRKVMLGHCFSPFPGVTPQVRHTVVPMRSAGRSRERGSCLDRRT
jgi:hypothetical protein